MRRSAMKRSALMQGLQNMKQQQQQDSPSHHIDDAEDSDCDMSCSSPASSPAISSRSLSPNDMIIESPSSSPASSPQITTRQLLSNIRINVPYKHDEDEDDDVLSPSVSCIEDEQTTTETINIKEDTTTSTTTQSKSSSIPSTYPGLGQRYTVTSTIQESLFGSVHLAIDTVCNRRVAIKISKRSLTATGIARSGNPVLENVKNEAHMMRTLSGANNHVVPLLDEIEDHLNHYLICPYYDQGDLYTYLTTLPHTRMQEPEARHTFRQLVEGVLYMHQHGVAHRDLSLENVMLNKNKNGSLDAYVIDLGVAAVNPLGPGSATFPCPGARLASEKPGKAMYISPELWSGNEWEAYSNDVFSLGVILYCMLVGRQPFNSSIDVWAQFITSGKWSKLLQHCADGKISPSSIDPGNYNYWVAAYQHLSVSVLDLIAKLLCPINKRLTLIQILNHPWMKQQQ